MAMADKKKKFAATPNTVESIGQWNIKYLQYIFSFMLSKLI